jgi:hypothetical protein
MDERQPQASAHLFRAQATQTGEFGIRANQNWRDSDSILAPLAEGGPVGSTLVGAFRLRLADWVEQVERHCLLVHLPLC